MHAASIRKSSFAWLLVIASGCGRLRGGGSDCDGQRIHADAEAIEAARASWTPASGTDTDRSLQAANALWLGCGDALPDETRRVLDLSVRHPPAGYELEGKPMPAIPEDPLATMLPGHLEVHDVTPPLAADDGNLLALCPSYPELTARLGATPTPAPAAALFDGCRLGDAADPIVTRDEFLRVGMSSLGLRALALTGWLREHGVDETDARTLTRELAFSREGAMRPLSIEMYDDIRLPAASRGEPVQGGVVYVAPGWIRIGDRTVIDLDGGRLPIGDDALGVLPSLLAEEADSGRTLNPPHGWPLLISADRDIPWSTVAAVAEAGVHAGFPGAALIVLVDDRIEPLRGLEVADSGEPLVVPENATVQDAASRAMTR